ncbi:MAG: HEAT repeat domain-containing protein, partial [Waterburya sp.]
YISDWLEDTEEDFFSIVFSLSSITTKNVFISIAEYALKKYTENLLGNQYINENISIILFCLIHNLNTPPSVLDRLATTICFDELGEWWEETYDDDDDGIFEVILEQLKANPHTFSTTLDKLVESKKSLYLAQYPKTSLATLEQLSKHENHEVRLEVAANSNTSIEVLKELLNDPGERVRLAAENNPTMSEYQGALKLQAADTKASKNILKKLAKHQNYEVRQEVAKNTTTPTDVLISLAEDDNEKVRLAVATNSNTTIEVLGNLAEDDNEKVRLAIATNSNTTIEVLENLAEDDNEEVRLAALNNPNTPAKTKKQIEKDEQNIEEAKQVALNSKTATKKIKNLAHHKYWKVREAIAANCSVTKILESLAQDRNVAVRAAVASNSNTTKEILELLKDDPECIVRESVVKHPHLSFYSFIEFLKDENYSISSTASEIAGQQISSVYIYIGDDAASDWLRSQEEYEGSVTDFDSVDDFNERDISYTEMYEACGFSDLEISSKNNNGTENIDFDDGAVSMLYALSDAIDRKEIELDIYWG